MNTALSLDIEKRFMPQRQLRTRPGKCFVWNADETRIGKPKKQETPDVSISATTKTGTVTIADEREDNQLTVLTAISAFEDSIPPLFITGNKAFE
jgi:hypothetical protein